MKTLLKRNQISNKVIWLEDWFQLGLKRGMIDVIDEFEFIN